MEKFSVIIPAHNEEQYLEKTIEGFLKNNIPFELIVVCDACSDNSFGISQKYTSKVYNVNYRNVSKARNFGAEKSLGTILVFNDADTVVSENYLAEISKSLENNDFGSAKWISESGSLFGKYNAWSTNNYNKKNIGGNFFIKKDLFGRLGGFNEKMIKGEDTDLGDRAKKIGAKHGFLKNCWIIPSERKYQQKGYFNLMIKSGIEGLLYKFFRNYYNSKIANKVE